jgi:hypothetical protein
MSRGGKLEVVDTQRIVKNREQKVRKEWCRNDAETRRRKAATEVITTEYAEYAERKAARTWECGVRSAACGMESAVC